MLPVADPKRGTSGEAIKDFFWHYLWRRSRLAPRLSSASMLTSVPTKSSASCRERRAYRENHPEGEIMSPGLGRMRQVEMACWRPLRSSAMSGSAVIPSDATLRCWVCASQLFGVREAEQELDVMKA